jgi:hypothetical protein
LLSPQSKRDAVIHGSDSATVPVSVKSMRTCTDEKIRETETQTNFSTGIATEVQTDISGIEDLIAFSQPLTDFHETFEVTDIQVEELINYGVYAPETPALQRLVCCKCQKDETFEKLVKCYSKGMEKLKTLCKIHGHHDVLDVIEEQWKLGRLRIHETCRLILHNEDLKHSRQGKSDYFWLQVVVSCEYFIS